MFTTITIKDKEYQLSLPIKQAIILEEKLGCNPLQVIGEWDEHKLPTFSQLSYFLWAMLQKYNHGITLDMAFDLLQDFKEDNNVFELIPIIVEVMEKDGYISNEDNEKN